ncbi:SMI1/KNR4 family protein [Streptomyces sp. NPDC054838]
MRRSNVPPAQVKRHQRAASLRRCASRLGHTLPEDLTALLRESNGVEDEYADGLIWSAERITSENLTMREDIELATLYMPFDPLLFFADAGNGDLFALLPSRVSARSSRAHPVPPA